MERDARRATVVGVAALAGWIVVVAAGAVVRVVDARVEGGHASRRHRAARFLAVLVSQTTLQQALAFPLPFFARTLLAQADGGAVVWTHAPFVLAYLAAIVVVGWDPAWEATLRRPALSMAVQAFAALVALLVAMPMLGLSGPASAAAAAAIVAIAAVVGAAILGLRGRRRRGPAGGLALIAAVLVVLGVRFVPPAPLAIGSATLAVDVVDREPVGAATAFTAPPTLACHTGIRAPLGLRDELSHVWRRDGVEVARVPLAIAGGPRTGGFRTWSRVRSPAPGRWECRVETALGQVVGAVRGVVRP
jgi:hypothetical protein